MSRSIFSIPYSKIIMLVWMIIMFLNVKIGGKKHSYQKNGDIIATEL